MSGHPSSEAVRIEKSSTHRSQYTLRCGTWLPAPIDQVFQFFADASQLETITPPWLRFRVVTTTPIEMREGTLIDYRLRLRGIPLRWKTIISTWQPPHRFVDEQLKGPYQLWRHEHTFQPDGKGTQVRDRVDYAFLCSAVLQPLIVRRDLVRIFTFRQERLWEIFSLNRPQ